MKTEKKMRIKSDSTVYMTLIGFHLLKFDSHISSKVKKKYIYTRGSPTYFFKHKTPACDI